jgi:hypothetical protein
MRFMRVRLSVFDLAFSGRHWEICQAKLSLFSDVIELLVRANSSWREIRGRY